MKRLFKRIINSIVYRLPKRIGRKLLYKKRMKKSLNLDNPKDFNEKINWLIVNEYDEKYGNLADKYKVREYITQKGYEEILPKLYKTYSNANDINFNELPDTFVLKPNNGCGHIFVCKDKNAFDKEKCIRELNKAIRQNFAKESLEYHYSFIEPKIICEEYLNDGTDSLPLDYKFFCFSGNVECVLVCSDRENNNYRDYYDLQWNKLNYTKEARQSKVEIEKPKHFDKMIEIASNLSENFKFVRVDLYNINGRIYFGELTFSPCAGFNKNINQEVLNHFGDLIKI